MLPSGRILVGSIEMGPMGVGVVLLEVAVVVFNAASRRYRDR